MRRGQIWTVAGRGDDVDKPRTVVIIQDDRFDATKSITICPLTSDDTNAPLMRLRLDPNDRNGLTLSCRIMVDKISTVRKTRLRAQVGYVDDADIVRLNAAVLVFLG